MIIRKGMGALGNFALQFNGQVVDRGVFEVMFVPQVMPTGVQILAIDRNDLGMIPTGSIAPSSNPHEDGRVLGKVLCERLDDLCTIHLFSFIRAIQQIRQTLVRSNTTT